MGCTCDSLETMANHKSNQPFISKSLFHLLTHTCMCVSKSHGNGTLTCDRGHVRSADLTAFSFVMTRVDLLQNLNAGKMKLEIWRTDLGWRTKPTCSKMPVNKLPITEHLLTVSTSQTIIMQLGELNECSLHPLLNKPGHVPSVWTAEFISGLIYSVCELIFRLS